ncbi:MAG: intradiol ring-cleavage dioxygenase [Saprospiraceae bacterium]|nr:intradiol ring-cleavage dioxygenase [Saprospiraceae bacterium]
MNHVNHLLPALLLLALPACKGQPANPDNSTATATARPIRTFSERCEHCDLMYIGMPADINSVDTSIGWTEQKQKLVITGTVYQLDGKTPASDIIVYYYHTDDEGYYSPRAGMDEKETQHGHLRGWIKTGADGKYAIYTGRPASYPNGRAPQHIHLLIKEPDLDNEYYIDDFVFDDDPNLVETERKRLQNRGGNGILKVKQSGDVQMASHDIILGLNIPGYPQAGR